jgi:hypothetical protein
VSFYEKVIKVKADVAALLMFDFRHISTEKFALGSLGHALFCECRNQWHTFPTSAERRRRGRKLTFMLLWEEYRRRRLEHFHSA